jgi:hypothetical protein
MRSRLFATAFIDYWPLLLKKLQKHLAKFSAWKRRLMKLMNSLLFVLITSDAYMKLIEGFWLEQFYAIEEVNYEAEIEKY